MSERGNFFVSKAGPEYDRLSGPRVYARASEFEGRRVLVTSSSDLLQFGNEHRDLHRAGTAGNAWRHLVRQYAINEISGNPISPIGSEAVPEFPLRFLTLPTADDILQINGIYAPYDRKTNDLVVESLVPYVELLYQRIEELGVDEGVDSVLKKMGPKKFRPPTLEFLRHYVGETLGESS